VTRPEPTLVNNAALHITAADVSRTENKDHTHRAPRYSSTVVTPTVHSQHCQLTASVEIAQNLSNLKLSCRNFVSEEKNVHSLAHQLQLLRRGYFTQCGKLSRGNLWKIHCGMFRKLPLIAFPHSAAEKFHISADHKTTVCSHCTTDVQTMHSSVRCPAVPSFHILCGPFAKEQRSLLRLWYFYASL